MSCRAARTSRASSSAVDSLPLPPYRDEPKRSIWSKKFGPEALAGEGRHRRVRRAPRPEPSACSPIRTVTRRRRRAGRHRQGHLLRFLPADAVVHFFGDGENDLGIMRAPRVVPHTVSNGKDIVKRCVSREGRLHRGGAGGLWRLGAARAFASRAGAPRRFLRRSLPAPRPSRSCGRCHPVLPIPAVPPAPHVPGARHPTRGWTYDGPVIFSIGCFFVGVGSQRFRIAGEKAVGALSWADFVGVAAGGHRRGDEPIAAVLGRHPVAGRQSLHRRGAARHRRARRAARRHTPADRGAAVIAFGSLEGGSIGARVDPGVCSARGCCPSSSSSTSFTRCCCSLLTYLVACLYGGAGHSSGRLIRSFLLGPIPLSVVAGLSLNVMGIDVGPKFHEVLSAAGYLILPAVLTILGLRFTFAGNTSRSRSSRRSRRS